MNYNMIFTCSIDISSIIILALLENFDLVVISQVPAMGGLVTTEIELIDIET